MSIYPSARKGQVPRKFTIRDVDLLGTAMMIVQTPDQVVRAAVVKAGWPRFFEPGVSIDSVAQYQYDALGRRIKKVVTNSGTLDGTQYAYYNDRWQLLETRNGSEALESQAVFGTQYVDEIVRWWRDGRGAMYVFQDANWNVTSTVSYMTQPLDRVRTTPYGQPTFDVEIVNGDWDDDGDTDSADIDACLDCFSVGDEGDCRIYDYDDNGTINLNDYFDLLALMPAGTSLQRQPGRRTSPNRFPYAYQGLAIDLESMTYYNRTRVYFSRIVRYGQPDAILAPNLFTHESNNPVNKLDPSGMYPYRCRYSVGNMDLDICQTANAWGWWDNKNPNLGPLWGYANGVTDCCFYANDFSGYTSCEVFTCNRLVGPEFGSCERNCVEQHEAVRRATMRCGFSYSGATCFGTQLGQCGPADDVPMWWRDCEAYSVSAPCKEQCGDEAAPGAACFSRCIQKATCDEQKSAQEAGPACQSECWPK